MGVVVLRGELVGKHDLRGILESETDDVAVVVEWRDSVDPAGVDERVVDLGESEPRLGPRAEMHLASGDELFGAWLEDLGKLR